MTSRAMAADDKRIPVYLLTGFLGSGKTSLLKKWLQQEAFADAGLIINELGEVGLDNQILSAASESSTLLANACACCSGLPGLADAMESLFWARLERRVPRFNSLMIETTGLAMPRPIVQTLASSELLRERYRLAGVVTCLSAPTAHEILASFEEARQQVSASDVLIMTKADLLDSTTLHTLQGQIATQCENWRVHTRIRTSALGNYSAGQLLQDLAAPADPSSDLLGSSDLRSAIPPQQQQAHDHSEHDEHHHAKAYFWPIEACCTEHWLQSQLEALQIELGRQLLRVKGQIQTTQGTRLLHMTPLTAAISISPADTGAPDKFGLTLIVSQPLAQQQSEALTALLSKRP